MIGNSDIVSKIAAEFSEAYSFSRSRWARFATELHPELSGMTMIILQFIKRKGPISATDLSCLLNMDKSFVSRQVSKLRELGLVLASEDEEDRRIQKLTTTPEAEKLINKFRQIWANDYQQVFAQWSETELQTFQSMLKKFNKSRSV